MGKKTLGFAGSVYLCWGEGTREFGFLFGQQPFDRSPLVRIDLGRKQLFEMCNVEVRNGSIHDRLLRLQSLAVTPARPDTTISPVQPTLSSLGFRFPVPAKVF
jgi:hypothetical protein